MTSPPDAVIHHRIVILRYVVSHPTSYKDDDDKTISVSEQASATLKNVGD
jgi:hypothetical protein